MSQRSLDHYRAPGAMTALPDHAALADLPTDLDALRCAVQGLLLHRDWAPVYGVTGDAIRIDEQNLRSTVDVLTRAFEISDAPVTAARRPIDRVLCICRHFTLLHTALLRSEGVPARVRCGFSNYFDPSKWYDHWITERWNGERWVRDDPQVDELQAKTVNLDFDPYDQPPGKFLTGSEAWIAARAGEVDANLFGIFDMWGLAFVAGNVISDFACLNKVELLPWDGWGMMTGPHDPVTDEAAAVLDDLAALASSDDFDAIRDRYLNDDRLRVPPDITSFIDGELIDVHLELRRALQALQQRRRRGAFCWPPTTQAAPFRRCSRWPAGGSTPSPAGDRPPITTDSKEGVTCPPTSTKGSSRGRATSTRGPSARPRRPPAYPSSRATSPSCPMPTSVSVPRSAR